MWRRKGNYQIRRCKEQLEDSSFKISQINMDVQKYRTVRGGGTIPGRGSEQPLT